MSSNSESKMNYKDTLNLPKTDFPMKANLSQREPELQRKWKDISLYTMIRDKSRGKEKFVFHDGPPYANGPIHIGHLLNKVLKDIVVRSKTMEGYNVDFIPGWDCHGLPIEHKVLKEIGKESEEYSVMKIRRKCQNYAEKYVKLQSKQMQRLGTVADYENPYLTMTPDYEAGVLDVFSRLVERGLVYRDLKPVHWSIENRTALADAELEYHDRTDKSIYVMFTVETADKLPSSLNVSQGETVSLMIWTTTPWTLPANLAVAVSPEGSYGLYKFTKEGIEHKVIIAENLAGRVFELGKVEEYQKIGSCSGRSLADAQIEYRHPFMDITGRVVTADYVTFEDGTGLVHTAPGHGVEDYQTGLREGLGIYCPVQEDGTFDDTVPDWISGKDVWTANYKITEELDKSGKLFHQHEFEHSYPHDWRSKTPTIFRATEQWFIGVDRKFKIDGETTLRELALESIEYEVNFYPLWGRNRLRGMLENRPDWCISRQRAWGLPIPAFTDEQGRVLLTPDSVRAVAGKVAEKGSNTWFLSSASELLEDYDPANDDRAPEWIGTVSFDELQKGMDIFDVWFESGSSWNSVLKKRGIGFPADLYLEGSDQHRGWFQLSLLPSLGANGTSPFRSLLTHGFMVDAKGRKMSKSGGNAIDVEDILKKHGADVCRWWVSTLKYSNDIKVDWEFFKVAADEYRKVRNTIRFLLGNLYDFNPEKDHIEFGEEDKYTVDYWALGKLNEFVEETVRSYSQFDYKRASELIFEFCYETLSATYLVTVKDRLYCDRTDSRRRRRTQTVMYKAADCLIRLLAPILVHTAEESYASLKGEGVMSVHLTEFPGEQVGSLEPVWEKIMDARDRVLKALEQAKSEKNINNPLDAGISLVVTSGDFEKLKKYEKDMADLCGVSRFEIAEGNSTGITVYDLSSHPRCERSWKRDETVRERAGGMVLSDRDAEAVGVS